MEKELELEFDEFEEITEVAEDYSEGKVYEDGSSFSGEEMEYWNQLLNQGNELLEQGYSEEETINLLQGHFRDYVEKNDLQEFINSEKIHGFGKDDISPKAWELYEQNVGKMTISQAIVEADDFIEGLNSDIKPVYKRSKRYSDDFLEGFNYE